MAQTKQDTQAQAQAILEEAKAEAQRQAQILLEEARAQALAITTEAENRAGQIVQDVTALSAFKTGGYQTPKNSASNVYEGGLPTACRKCGSKLQSIVGGDKTQHIVCTAGDPKCPRAGK